MTGRAPPPAGRWSAMSGDSSPFGVLSPDGRLLFATRTIRVFGYGFLSVVLVLYLAALGIDDFRIGLILTLTLIGDAGISLWLTTRADSIGRRRVLEVGSALMAAAGVVFVVSSDFWVLVVAATLGVISVSGGEVGPFLAVEQASLSDILPDSERTRIFGWYSLVGLFATGLGALAAGLLAQGLRSIGASELDSYRAIVLVYAAFGFILLIAFARLTSAIEIAPSSRSAVAGRLGLHRSSRTVLRLSGLLGLDSFGGALVSQSLVAYWLTLRYGAEPAMLGAIFFAANILAGVSSLVAARLAGRIGLIRTMVFTHLPSNALLLLLPLMPTLSLAALVLLVHFSLNKMDIPARQSYILAVVDPNERSAAAGVSGMARTVGAAAGPAIATPLIGIATLASLPFFIAGGVKIAYDVLLYRLFIGLRPPEEGPRTGLLGGWHRGDGPSKPPSRPGFADRRCSDDLAQVPSDDVGSADAAARSSEPEPELGKLDGRPSENTDALPTAAERTPPA
jgi:MFS family permease